MENKQELKITMIESPTEKDWLEVKRRALVTMGLNPKNGPDFSWKKRILQAEHSPIRRLFFSFYIENIPSWVATHLCRHIHAQPYVKSQRNDRQDNYDRNKAPQDAPVDMIWDMNAEELMTVAHKRLCNQASLETRKVVREICRLVLDKYPEFEGLLVPQCEYRNGKCTEMFPCEKAKTFNK